NNRNNDRSGCMSEYAHERFEIPQEMRSMAETSFRQARETFDRLVAGAEAAADSMGERGETMRAGAKDIGDRTIAFAGTNRQASPDYAQSLVHARGLPEVVRLHSEYVQAQMRALAEQASEMGRIVSRAAIEATKPKH